MKNGRSDGQGLLPAFFTSSSVVPGGRISLLLAFYALVPSNPPEDKHILSYELKSEHV